jgi:hypothetical protein
MAFQPSSPITVRMLRPKDVSSPGMPGPAVRADGRGGGGGVAVGQEPVEVAVLGEGGESRRRAPVGRVVRLGRPVEA